MHSLEIIIALNKKQEEDREIRNEREEQYEAHIVKRYFSEEDKKFLSSYCNIRY